ncbi:iron uptake porin [Synechococcus sp. MIT S1220]|uniref:iron uptake porin n=1 Tax=Synechococcus sp. MIT S1220 TaxID=3082549 RepID=UPI0039AF2CFB
MVRPVNANTVDLDSINNYVSHPKTSREQVTSITQFSDVYPTDWAYQALANLIERYGCVAGYPNGSFSGNRAMTRYEAAALLNTCLDRITEITGELRRLIKEFERELAIIRGRVDGLEARVGELESSQFSTTTTKLDGQATFVVGANRFQGSSGRLRNENNREYGATVFNYDLQLNLETSFTGKDLLTTVLRSGNFDEVDNPFGSGGPSGLATLDAAFQEGDDPSHVAIEKIFYSFPVGDSFTFTVGALVGQEDMLALWPSAYPSDPILEVMNMNGAPAAYNKNLGPGAGISWELENGFSLSANYVAANGAEGNSSDGGIAMAQSGSTATVQLGWEGESWNVAAIYSKIQNGHDLIPYITPFADDRSYRKGTANAFGLGGSWTPEDSGWIPSVSAGWGYNSMNTDRSGQVEITQSWTVGLEWNDVFLLGNNAGMAVGQPVFATSLRGDETPADGQFIWEWWYQFQVTNNISVTPALFYLSRPLGENTPSDQTFQQLGGLVKTTFAF